ncbi:unnamed protein product [Linum trigynum]|uniref:Uncharacterized protein n=1 Tax=Linum trigynum TaxID=586398 RepID=A0AAV2F6S2_9ROSI
MELADSKSTNPKQCVQHRHLSLDLRNCQRAAPIPLLSQIQRHQWHPTPPHLLRNRRRRSVTPQLVMMSVISLDAVEVGGEAVALGAEESGKIKEELRSNESVKGTGWVGEI